MVEIEPAKSSTELKRTLSFGFVAPNGLGTTTRAGILVLIVKVGGYGGELAPLSFLVAAALAGSLEYRQRSASAYACAWLIRVMAAFARSSSSNCSRRRFRSSNAPLDTGFCFEITFPILLAD